MLQFRLKFLYLLVFCDTIEIKFCAFYQGPTVENWVKRIEVLSLHKRNKYQWANVINKQIRKRSHAFTSIDMMCWLMTHAHDQTKLTRDTHAITNTDCQYNQIHWVTVRHLTLSQEDSRAWHAHCSVHPLPFIISRGGLLSRAGEEGWRLSPQCPVLSARHVTLLSPGTCLGLSLVHYPPVPLWLVKLVRQFWPAKKILLRKKEGIKHQMEMQSFLKNL